MSRVEKNPRACYLNPVFSPVNQVRFVTRCLEIVLPGSETVVYDTVNKHKTGSHEALSRSAEGRKKEDNAKPLKHGDAFRKVKRVTLRG